MRVIHVITRLIIGGAQENTIASVLGLRAKPGVQVHLISGPAAGPEGSLQSQFAAAPELLTIVPSLIRNLNPWQDLRALGTLTRMLRTQAPELVHTHSGKAGFLGRLAARRAGVQCIVHTIHGPSFGPFQGAAANLLFRAAERYAGRCTTHFVTVAEAMTRQYLAAGIGRPEHYTRLYSGFDLQPFANARNEPLLRARLGLEKDDFVVGKIARLFKLKGHEDLLEVAPALVRQAPRTKFLLVGDGMLRGEFESRVRSLGLENNFVFTGLVPPAQIPSLVGIMDVLVHLSRREGLARSLAQALAAGRPVVACDCDGAGEVCINDETGFLIQPGDGQALVRRLVQLEKDPALRQRLGARGREHALARFSVARMVDELYSLYQRLLA